MDSSYKFPLVDVCAAINTAIGRNEFSPAPVYIEDLINHITAISRRFRFKFDEEMINVLQFCQEKSLICLRGLFGFCDPDSCPSCQVFKKEQLPRLWTIWIKQHKPVLIDEPIRTIAVPVFIDAISLDEKKDVPDVQKPHTKPDVCRFGKDCTNKKCPYTHPKIIKCYFGSECTNKKCPYSHPKSPCKYGSECKKIGCVYEHPKKSDKTETPKKMKSQIKCKSGALCTKKGCAFKHPKKLETVDSNASGFLQVPFGSPKKDKTPKKSTK